MRSIPAPAPVPLTRERLDLGPAARLHQHLGHRIRYYTTQCMGAIPPNLCRKHVSLLFPSPASALILALLPACTSIWATGSACRYTDTPPAEHPEIITSVAARQERQRRQEDEMWDGNG
jgi:hypothetical protein